MSVPKSDKGREKKVKGYTCTRGKRRKREDREEGKGEKEKEK